MLALVPCTLGVGPFCCLSPEAPSFLRCTDPHEQLPLGFSSLPTRILETTSRGHISQRGEYLPPSLRPYPSSLWYNHSLTFSSSLRASPSTSLSLICHWVLPLHRFLPPSLKDTFPLLHVHQYQHRGSSEDHSPNPSADTHKERGWHEAGKRKVLACASWQGPGWNRREGSWAQGERFRCCRSSSSLTDVSLWEKVRAFLLTIFFSLKATTLRKSSNFAVCSKGAGNPLY